MPLTDTILPLYQYTDSIFWNKIVALRTLQQNSEESSSGSFEALKTGIMRISHVRTVTFKYFGTKSN